MLDLSFILFYKEEENYAIFVSLLKATNFVLMTLYFKYQICFNYIISAVCKKLSKMHNFFFQ